MRERGLRRAERYGLVGANGSGETTLLRILSGDIEPDEGVFSIPRSVRLGVLRQDQFLYEDQEILSVALMGHRELGEALVAKEELLARPREQFDVERFAQLEETIQRLDGYAAESRAAEILEGLGIPAEVHRRPLSTSSGGFKLRVLLAQMLASSPDVLLPDEPTNHLDIESIKALVAGLKAFDGTLIMVSHDRWFVRELATRIMEITPQGILDFPGTYDEYVHACGDDHLDVDAVLLEARRAASAKERGSRRAEGRREGREASARRKVNPYRLRQLERRRDDVLAEIEAAERRVAEIDATFADSEYYGWTPVEQVQALQREREALVQRVELLLREWEGVEQELAASAG